MKMATKAAEQQLPQKTPPYPSAARISDSQCYSQCAATLKYKDVDGAYFGTTFPSLFLITCRHLNPQKPTTSYIPRLFGFKIHKS